MILRALALLLSLTSASALAEEFSGLARLDMAQSAVTDTRRGLAVELTLSQGVPFRVFALDRPERLVIDFREIDWTGASPEALDQSAQVTAVHIGQLRPGWSRMVVDLGGPFLLTTANMSVDQSDGSAVLTVDLAETDAASFAAAAGAPPESFLGIGQTARANADDGRFRIVIDPGHGGVDPGADQGGVLEKDLMLTFAHELKDVLLRSGDVDVFLTREEDVFVSLDRRVAIAHRVRADVFLSLHADALSEGRAHGATVYTLSETASDKASAALAERHNRNDILSGIDLSGQDDIVAGVLMDLARQETQPRTEKLAEALRLGIQQRALKLNRRPMRQAGFSVLRSPDIPSVLLEVGFLSSEADRENIKNPAWRAVMAEALRDALFAWHRADAAQAELVRQ